MKLKLYLGLLISVISFSCDRTVDSSETKAISETICQYNPDFGEPNPLGMRAYITLNEKEGNTAVIFEQFPSFVSAEGNKSAEAVTISTTIEMILYKTSIDENRKFLVENNNYYSELLGYEDPNGFASFNKLLSCKKAELTSDKR